MEIVRRTSAGLMNFNSKKKMNSARCSKMLSLEKWPIVDDKEPASLISRAGLFKAGLG